LFRQIARALLDDLLTLPAYDLEVSLLADPAMTRLNEQFVHHAGSTDVITFDYSDPPPPASGIHGELFLCPDEALRQARLFRTTWQSELVRYLVHGVLHLLGHDDQSPVLRRQMKRAENQLLRALTSQFPLEHLARPIGRSADIPVRLGDAQTGRADKNVRAPGRPEHGRPAEQSL
jgi:probable rRNA maturation factor